MNGSGNIDWERFTFARVRVLREIEARFTLQAVSDHLQLSYNTVRSYVEELKAMTGCSDVRELGRWWEEHRASWEVWCAEQARGSEGPAGDRRR
ncbi:MAG TPA: hypothetical protein VJQ83_12960 [Tepidiformaceae bacterium]|nr:hypothetical protein [Tepidiformaceae bacterium]